jgi:hypothetical protein
MEQMTDLNATFHIRMASILSLLSLVDAVFLTVAVTSILTKGPDMMLVFAFEVGIPVFPCMQTYSQPIQLTMLLSMMIATAGKYALHTVDLRSENPWEEKSQYIFYIELVTGMRLYICIECNGHLMLTLGEQTLSSSSFSSCSLSWLFYTMVSPFTSSETYTLLFGASLQNAQTCTSTDWQQQICGPGIQRQHSRNWTTRTNSVSFAAKKWRYRLRINWKHHHSYQRN